MSTVVALTTEGGAWIGADSRATCEDGEIRPGDAEKIFKNGRYIVGFIGSVRGGQILRPEYFDAPEKITDWPDAVVDQSEIKGCLGQSEQQTALMLCNYVIGDTRTGKVYEMLIDFQFTEIKEYTCVGSGGPYAFGSLFTTEELNINGEERVRMALEAAIKFDGASGGPIHIMKVE